MIIKILNKFEYQSYPVSLKDDTINISEEVLREIGITKCFDVINKKVIDYSFNEDDTYKKIDTLKQKLNDTDYKLFKYLEGDLTKEEYLPIMENRKRWRKEINELEGESAPNMPAQIK